MSLVPALLQAIVRIDGEALVMHAGDKPYVVSPTEQVDLASRGLTLEAVNGIVAQILPAELQNALDEFGAVQHELAPLPDFPGEHFTVVAARGGDDVWVEIRRRRIPDDDRVPEELFGPAQAPPPSQPIASHGLATPPVAAIATPVVYDNDELPVEMLGFDSPPVEEHKSRVVEAVIHTHVDEGVTSDDDLLLPDEAHLWPGQTGSPAAALPDAVAAMAHGEEVEIDLDLDQELEAAEAKPEQPAARAAAAEEMQREAARVAAVEEAKREAERVAAEEAQREAARVAAAEEAKREAERLAAEEAEREAARVAAAEEARREAERLAAEEAQREAARLAAEEAAREVARVAAAAEEARREAERLAAEEVQREAARLAAEEAAREVARVAAAAEEARREAERLAAEEAQREAARLAAEEAAREVARVAAAAEEARREAERLAAEEAQREAARVAAAEEAAREAARVAAAEEARREAERVAAEEAQREAARLAVEEAAREADRVAAAEEARREAERVAAEEAQREAARLAAAEEARREAERIAAEEAEREAARVAAAEEAEREAARVAAAEEARREAERLAAEEAAREAARVAAAEEARREAERLAAEEAQREAARLAAAEEARREAERIAAEEAEREAARVAAAEEAEREAARVAAAEEARREAERLAAEEAARVVAAEEAQREAERIAAEEAARVAAAEEAQREAARLAAEEAARAAAREAARVAAAEEARREAERIAVEEAEREAARVAAAEEAEREAARVAAAEEARREAERIAAEEAEREAARVAAAEEAEREAARVAAAEEARREAERLAAEEAAREAARVAAAEEAQREAARLAAEEAAREAARVAAAEEARREVERIAAEEAEREAARVAAAEEAEREAVRVAAAEDARREAERIAAERFAASFEAPSEVLPIAGFLAAVGESDRVPATDEAGVRGDSTWVGPQLDAAPMAASIEDPYEAALLSAVDAQIEADHLVASVDEPDMMSFAALQTDSAFASVLAPHEIAPLEAYDVEPAVASVDSVAEMTPFQAWSEPHLEADPFGAPFEAQQLPLVALPPSSQVRALPLQPAVVLNLSRSPIRPDAPPPLVEDPMLSGLERLLRVSSARGASTLYLSSGSRPSVRVDGELQMLDGEPVHVARDVESLLLTLMPERSHEALRTGAATEWITDLEGVGRVRCMSFRDQRGPGGVFRLMPTRSVSADELALPKAVQALAVEPEGLVLIAGARSSGKRTTMAAFVDLMNRTRRDHIITIEREINIQHERANSFISQREVRGNDDDVLAAARAALREDPDVLVIEELRTSALVNLALEAAAAGRLVVGGFTAHTATGAIDRIIDLYSPDHHRQVQMALADSMRGVIAQVLLRKIGGGRLPAREVLLNTPAVSSVIAGGKTSQLPMAIEGGRGHGMMPLNDALVGLVRNGSVEAREAYRHSPDRAGFLAALNRQGVDTSFAERLANG